MNKCQNIFSLLYHILYSFENQKIKNKFETNRNRNHVNIPVFPRFFYPRSITINGKNYSNKIKKRPRLKLLTRYNILSETTTKTHDWKEITCRNCSTCLRGKYIIKKHKKNEHIIPRSEPYELFAIILRISWTVCVTLVLDRVEIPKTNMAQRVL